MQPSLDRIIGNNIRYHRARLGLSQKQLGALLGLSFQQVQKYERGINQVSASRLYQLTKIFDCTMDCLCNNTGKDITVPFLKTATHSDYTLIMDFERIRNEAIRHNIRSLIHTLATHKKTAASLPRR